MKRIFNWKNLPILYSYGIVLSIFIFFWISYGIHHTMPALVKQTGDINVFVGENAKNYLKPLTDMGPKLVGSTENEVTAVEYLKAEFETIKEEKHDVQYLELDVQEVNPGSYYIGDDPIGYYYYYEHIRNVVVRVRGKNNGKTAVLVNAHYDTVPESPGGSDDNIMIAVMLETLRVISKSPVVPDNDVIFLFNGAEEVGLLASHGFITQHAWASSCKVLVNLEATGAGGKAILFQAGPGNTWLMDYYIDIPHPHAQVAGQELFESGFVPSDTDFRIFRDYGGMIGFDMAFYEDGYRYHTKYDGFSNIADEVYQHTGDNLLHLVKKLSTESELGQKYDQSKANEDDDTRIIYYDFIGLFFIHYDVASELALNICTIIISIGTATWCMYKIDARPKPKWILGGVASGLVLLGWVLSFVFNVIIASILDAAYRSMTWYANVWIIFGLYGIPTLAISFSAVTALKLFQVKKPNGKENISKEMQAQMLNHIVRLIWTFILFLGTCFSIKSCYILIPYILLTSLGCVFVQVIRKQFTNYIWIPVHILTMILPTLFFMYISIVVSNLAIPIMGRFGPNTNPDLLVGCLMSLFVITTTCPFVSLMIYSRLDRIFYGVMAVILVIFLIIVATPAAFPYSGDSDNPKPQRYWIFHVDRTVIDESGNEILKDSGFTFNAYDRQSPYIIEDEVSEVNHRVSIADDCNKAVFCGLPTTTPKNLKNIEDTIWIPTPEAGDRPSATSLTSTNIENTNNNIYKYTFELLGPDRMNLYISPKKNMKVKSISLIETANDEGLAFNGQQVYYILITSGHNPTRIEFTIEVEDLNENPEMTSKRFDIGVAGKYIHKDINVLTPDYARFLASFPDWAVVTPWLSSYKSNVF